LPVPSCPAWSWQVVVFSAGGDGAEDGLITLAVMEAKAACWRRQSGDECAI